MSDEATRRSVKRSLATLGLLPPLFPLPIRISACCATRLAT